MSRMLPGTRALRTFESAGRHLNFTKAADEVGLTPAAVSYQIKELEEQLGVTLFTRSSRRIQLTPAGAVLLEATIDALDILQRAAGRARRIARDSKQLRISLGARFATHWLLPRLPQLRAANPDLELAFDISDQVREFETDDIDVAIRFGTGRYEEARAERLFGATLVPVCSPKLLEAGPRPATPADLLQYTLCHADCVVDGLTWPTWSQWMTSAGLADFDDGRCVAFPDSSHVIQAVLDGGAVGLVEQSMIASELAQGRLIQLFDVSISVADEYGYHLVYLESRSQDPRIAAFRSWLLGQIRPPVG